MLLRDVLVVEWLDVELGRLTGTVPGDVHQAVIHRSNSLLVLQVVAKVGHRTQDGEAGAPVLAMFHPI